MIINETEKKDFNECISPTSPLKPWELERTVLPLVKMLVKYDDLLGYLDLILMPISAFKTIDQYVLLHYHNAFAFRA